MNSFAIAFVVSEGALGNFPHLLLGFSNFSEYIKCAHHKHVTPTFKHNYLTDSEEVKTIISCKKMTATMKTRMRGTTATDIAAERRLINRRACLCVHKPCLFKVKAVRCRCYQWYSLESNKLVQMWEQSIYKMKIFVQNYFPPELMLMSLLICTYAPEPGMRDKLPKFLFLSSSYCLCRGGIIVFRRLPRL